MGCELGLVWRGHLCDLEMGWGFGEGEVDIDGTLFSKIIYSLSFY
jgi:hypothetical protein